MTDSMPPPPGPWIPSPPTAAPPTMIPATWSSAPPLAPVNQMTVELQLSNREYRRLHRRTSDEDGHLDTWAGVGVAVVTVILVGVVGLLLMIVALLIVKRWTGRSLVGKRERPKASGGRIAQRWTIGEAGLSFSDSVGHVDVPWSSIDRQDVGDHQIALALSDGGGTYVLSERTFPPEALQAVRAHTEQRRIPHAKEPNSSLTVVLAVLALLATVLVFVTLVVVDDDNGPFGRTCGPGEILVVTSSGSYCA